MKEIESKIENIEILLEANNQSINKILEDLSNSEKTRKEAQILNEAMNNLNMSSESLKLLISQENDLLSNFKPTIEHKHYTINIERPLIVSAIAFIIICWCAYWIVDLKDDNKHLEANDAKYRYLEVTKLNMEFYATSDSLTRTMNYFYKNEKEYVDSVIIVNEKEIEEEIRRNKLAKMKKEEAAILMKEADSLMK